MYKVAISGISGFIGKHLRQSLEREGNTVIGIDRELLKDQGRLCKALQDVKPDVIVHCAAFGNHGPQIDPQTIFDTNVVGTWNLLMASKDIPYKAFVNCGSSSEYGHKSEPMKETDLPETDFLYGASKVSATYLSRAFSKTYNKPITTIRPFSVYGEGEASFRFIPTIVKHMVNKTEMPFVSYPQHDWIYIEDVIQAFQQVIHNIDKVKGQVVNVGTGIATTNKEVATIMSYVTEKSVKTKEGSWNEQPHHSSVWVADNTLLKSLGWKQKIDLSEGLKRCYKYYSEKYGQQNKNT